MAKKIYEEGREDLKEDLKRIEEEIDKIVAELYGITDEELKEIRKCLMILKEGEIPEEEEEGSEEEEETVLPVEEVEVSVEPLLINENVEKELSCIISNNMEKDLQEVKIEILLNSNNLATKKIDKIEKTSLKNISFKVPKLKAGEYELIIKIKFEKNVLTEKRKLFVKKRKRKEIAKSALDDEIERMLK
ncbi:MAG TPA: hypothetical protein ENI33_04840 [Thermoplasmatales archaeon]|nr:hypothetical protein [Thermoplasmatales archaeon]